MKLDIIYEDDSIVLVNKPSGLLTIPDRYNPEKPNLTGYLQKKYGSIFTVHRLDRETSGIIVFARNAASHLALSQAFQLRTVKKKYLTVVTGNLPNDEGIIETGLALDPANPGKMKVMKGGKKSTTMYKVLERFKACNYVEVSIMTGRMHQIRVHFKSIGHPCYVDKLYGKNEAIYIKDVKQRNLNISKKPEEFELPLISRTTLHASQLEITHPVTNEVMTFEAALPKDMKALLNQLRKWA